MKPLIVWISLALMIYLAGSCAMDSAMESAAQHDPLECHGLTEAKCEALLESDY
jgi:hypothetical protein